MALAFIAGAARPALAQTVSVVEILPVAAAGRAASHASHTLTIFAYTFRGSAWRSAEITEALARAADLLVQCGVALAAGELRVIDAPQRFHFYSTAVSREFLREFESARPAIFFVQDTHNTPAFDAEAIGIANAAGRRELANTIWVAHGARDLPQAIAHELVHVLSDSGAHSDEPGNLMRAETSPANQRLSDAQCARLRERGEENGLLSRR